MCVPSRRGEAHGGTLMALQCCCRAEGGMSIGYEAAAAEELTLVICFFE